MHYMWNLYKKQRNCIDFINRTKCKYWPMYCSLDAWEIHAAYIFVLFYVCIQNSIFGTISLCCICWGMFLTKTDHAVKNAKATFSNRRTKLVFRESLTLKSSNIINTFSINTISRYTIHLLYANESRCSFYADVRNPGPYVWNTLM